MEIDFIYILSQIFTTLMYALLAWTYFLKDKRKIVIVSALSLVANTIAYILLGAWTGLAMCVVAMLRNLYILWDEKKYGKRKANEKTRLHLFSDSLSRYYSGHHSNLRRIFKPTFSFCNFGLYLFNLAEKHQNLQVLRYSSWHPMGRLQCLCKINFRCDSRKYLVSRFDYRLYCRSQIKQKW